MKRKSLWLWLGSAAVGSLLSAVVAPRSAQAQTTRASGFALDQFDPSERGSDWFALESLDLRGNLRPAIGIVGDYAYRPLAIYNSDGSVRSNILSDQFFVHVGASIVLVNRLRFGLNVPIALLQDGDGGTANGVSYPPPSAQSIGDVRLGADLRLLGEYGDPFTAALGVQVYFPTGSQNDYTGDGSIRVQPRLTAAGDVGIFTYAVKIGFEYRGLSATYGGSAVGNELVYGASVGLRLADKKLLIGPEVYGAAVLTDSNEIFATKTTPLEGILGAHYTIGEDWKIGLGGGTGLTRGYGAPTARGVAVIEWAPAVKKPPPPDRDNDTILDPQDACPDQPGVPTTDPTTNGCPPPPPPPADKDGDGIPDSQDACPDKPGVKTDDPNTNGCPPPPPDRDKDGIVDSEDACPDVAGVKTEDPKTNGCPPDPDRDKDGIPNEQDACPDNAGPANPDPKKNGCPQAVVKNNQIVILDQVKFATGSARILPASNGILEAVQTVLTEHPEITKVSIEGHTDNKGTAKLNKKLSADRAASVVTWLVTKGKIDKDRLSSVGYGQEQPIDTNETDEGRQNNRRVEFHILEQPK